MNDPITILTDENYDIFVCYYEDLAKDYASKIHSVLTERGYRVFVAHIARPFIVGDFREYVNSVIKKSNTFILINSLGALKRNEIIREVKEAFSKGNLQKHEFWIFRENNVDVPRGDDDFTEETKIDLADLSQDDFINDSELGRAVVRKCEYRRELPKAKMNTVAIRPNQVRVKLSIKPTFLINANAIIDEIQVEINNKNYEKAIELYDKVLNIDPLNIGALNGKGILFAILEKYDEADECFTNVIGLNNRFSAAWANKAYTLTLAGKNEQALESIQKALNIEESQINLAIKSHIFFELQRFEEAIKIYDKMLLQNPKSSEAISSKAAALARIGKFEEAKKLLNTAIRENKRNGNAWYNLGVLFAEEKKFEDALKCYDKSIELEPETSLAFLGKSIVLCVLGKYDDAVLVHDVEIQLNPKKAISYFHKASILNRLERYDEAVILFDKSLTINPKYVQAYVGKALSLENLKKHTEARSNVQKALQLENDSVDTLISCAEILSKQGAHQEAEEILKKVLSTSQKNQVARGLLGSVLFLQEKYSESVEFCTQSLQLEPKSIMMLVGRSASLIKLQRYDEAIKDCDTALQIDNTTAWAYYNKACAYAMMLQKDMAIELLDKSIKIDKACKGKAMSDSDFDKIRQDPKFKKLIEE